MKNIVEITIVLILVIEPLLLQIIRLRDIIINVVFFITIQSRLQYAEYVGRFDTNAYSKSTNFPE